MHGERSCCKSQLFVAQMKQQDAQQLGGFECQPPFNTPNEAQDPSYKKMQMVAQRPNDDGEPMTDKRGIGSRAELLLRLSSSARVRGRNLPGRGIPG
ncbi:unnamed protein product [Sphagnum troendelagicum]|uniref:Uncharacterized protein n=1 Tax=Sphagnum troendelagicum TaxID=128251 RepID=A0ABP0U083_9BRYO